MRKSRKRFFQKSLCGILSAAMLLSGLSIPELTAYAASADAGIEAEITEEGTEQNNNGTNLPDEPEQTPSTEGDDEVQNPTDGDENDIGDGDSSQGDENDGEASEGASDGDDAAASDEDVTLPDENTEEGNVGDGDDDIEKKPDKNTELIEAFATTEKKYTDQKVTFAFYVEDMSDEMGFWKYNDSGATITVDETVNPKLDWGGWDQPDKNPVYKLQEVTEHENWYQVTFTVTDTLTLDDTGACTGSLAGFNFFRESNKEDSGKIFECSGWNHSDIYAGLLAGEIKAVKGNETDGYAGYATIEDAEVSTEALTALVAKAKELKAEDYKESGWTVFQDALAAAEAVLAKETPTSSEVGEAYDNLDKAMKALVPAAVVSAEINVTPVALDDDFILGADISSYLSLKDSGTKFYDDKGKELDDQGFFNYLAEGGTNWVRIRVWNDPYDTDGNGYGGGNNDIDKAVTMGKWATNAGMKVLIDFHYSDFWADPGKQKAPKAWSSMSLTDKETAVGNFTTDCLNKLKEAGVNVGMVQVGNETNGGIAGETSAANMAKIFNAGSKAVREFDENILVALHFTNPEKGIPTSMSNTLNSNNVDYDVFATSYYPYWHGTLANLTSQLAYVAKTYNKKVMVAETSWATTLDDGDGWENTVREGNNDTGNDYSFSVQGQADEIRAVVNATNNINSVEGVEANSAIGVFYWEAAWISPNYVYDEYGNKDEAKYAANQEQWETKGSGWASAYAADYDPDDAGKWHGGGAVDNQAWFDFYGNALPTAKVYSHIRTGAEAVLAVASVEKPSITVDAEGTVEYPETVTVTFNDGTEQQCAVVWDETDKAKVDTSEAGTYKVKGTVTIQYTSAGEAKTVTRTVILTVTVVAPKGTNLLKNPGFEDDGTAHTGWTTSANSGFTGADKEKDWKENPHSGTYAMHFYNGNAFSGTVTQEVKDLEAGSYTFGAYIQGDGTADGDLQYAIATVYNADGNVVKDDYKASCALAGWRNWQNPEIKNIVVPEGGSVKVGMQVASTKGGAWGSLDDLYLFGTYSITVDSNIKQSEGKLTTNKTEAVDG